MPYRLNEWRAKIGFITSAEMPNMIYRACLKTGTVSNTVYIQHAVAEALSRDLEIPLQDILDNLPPPRGKAKDLILRGNPVRVGPGNCDEEVR